MAGDEGARAAVDEARAALPAAAAAVGDEADIVDPTELLPFDEDTELVSDPPPQRSRALFTCSSNLAINAQPKGSPVTLGAS